MHVCNVAGMLPIAFPANEAKVCINSIHNMPSNSQHQIEYKQQCIALIETWMARAHAFDESVHNLLENRYFDAKMAQMNKDLIYAQRQIGLYQHSLAGENAVYALSAQLKLVDAIKNEIEQCSIRPYLSNSFYYGQSCQFQRSAYNDYSANQTSKSSKSSKSSKLQTLFLNPNQVTSYIPSDAQI
jgi:hypothetical protein